MFFLTNVMFVCKRFFTGKLIPVIEIQYVNDLKITLKSMKFHWFSFVMLTELYRNVNVNVLTLFSPFDKFGSNDPSKKLVDAK